MEKSSLLSSSPPPHSKIQIDLSQNNDSVAVPVIKNEEYPQLLLVSVPNNNYIHEDNEIDKEENIKYEDPLECFNTGILLMSDDNDLDHERLQPSPAPPEYSESTHVDSLEDIHGKSRVTSLRPRLRRPLEAFAVGSAPANLSIHSSSSPANSFKKVQFEIGGDEEDEIDFNTQRQLDHNKTMSQPHLQVNSSTSGNEMTSISSGSGIPGRNSNRIDSRDYLLQPNAGVALLPAIAEEKSPRFLRSISADHSHQYQQQPPDYYDIDKIDKQSLPEVYGFVQLDVLRGDGDVHQREWKEYARWIKYEEDLEEGADRWGRPHVASLSFHSLIKLRQLIERDGIIMLDLDEKDMPGVAYRIVEELSSKNLIKTEESPLLMRALLLKHKHVQEGESHWFKLKRTNTSSVLSLHNVMDEKSRSKSMLDSALLVRRNSIQKTAQELSVRSLHRTGSGNNFLKPSRDHVSVEVKPIAMSDMYRPSEVSEEDLKWIQREERIKRLLPVGAEATMVMVGDFEGLKKPIFVFIRLLEAAFMFNVTEVPVPVRFFAILMVPTVVDIDVIEIGRSFGALMSNKNFNEIALNGTGRKNLMEGINEFLDDSIVLPPGDWDNEDLLPIHHLQSKSKSIRLRRLKKQYSFIKSEDSFCDGGPNGHITTDVPDISEKKDPYGDPLIRTRRPFGGVINDIRRRIRYYKSDVIDGLNAQCVATILFLYCASIAQIITFAGLMGEKTNDLIGMSESLMATCVAGIFFALFSGQPLIPIGPTGPLLVFDEILFLVCRRHEIEFLTARLWISIWLLIIIIIVVALEGSVLVRWFTRFTQDIFAVLTSVLLIFESVDNLIDVYVHHPLAVNPMDTRPIELTINTTHYSIRYEETTLPPILDESEDLRRQPNTALLCTILMLGTFFIAYFLREFRNSVFLGARARRALGDFGVPIAIITMVILDYSATDTYTQKMKVPPGLEPSNPEKGGWTIPFSGKHGDFDAKYAIGAVLPAILLFILIFMTTQICELIINKKERKLIKGSGFHLDILLIGLINIGSGIIGAPWLCCATLRALAHVTALTVYSTNNPPGEKPIIVEVKEQRVTALAVSLLIGCSVVMGPVLQHIPLAVLFGVFLYMGISSLSSTQLFERISLLFIPVEQHPQVPYVRRVRTWKMHMYTLIQIACLALLWSVKSIKEAALGFSFVLMFLVPIRMQLKFFFTENELEALDG